MMGNQLDTQALPLYNPASRCPKCQSYDVSARFVERNDVLNYGNVLSCRQNYGGEFEGEHLHRLCQSCFYGWSERCLDDAPPIKQPARPQYVQTMLDFLSPEPVRNPNLSWNVEAGE